MALWAARIGLLVQITLLLCLLAASQQTTRHQQRRQTRAKNGSRHRQPDAVADDRHRRQQQQLTLDYWAALTRPTSAASSSNKNGQSDRGLGTESDVRRSSLDGVRWHKSSGNRKHPNSRQSVRAAYISCYSCMAGDFVTYWDQLKDIYNDPKNFSDQCFDLPRRSRIGAVQCDSACVTIREHRVLGGQTLGYNVARGCSSSLLKNSLAFANKVRSSRRAYNSRQTQCPTIDSRDLSASPPQSVLKVWAHTAADQTVSMSFPISVCSCYTELCNNLPQGGAGGVSVSVLVIIIPLLASVGWHQLIIAR